MKASKKPKDGEAEERKIDQSENNAEEVESGKITGEDVEEETYPSDDEGKLEITLEDNIEEIKVDGEAQPTVDNDMSDDAIIVVDAWKRTLQGWPRSERQKCT